MYFSLDFIFFICISLIGFINSARILGIAHMSTYSHFILPDRIFKELARRGHEVTVISPFEQKVEMQNFQNVLLDGFNQDFNDLKKDLLKKVNTNFIVKQYGYELFALKYTESVLKHRNVQLLLNSNKTFDLVIHEKNFNDAFFGFSHYYGVPSIQISTVGITHQISSQMGNPHNPAYIPEIYKHFSRDMNLLERTMNTLSYVTGLLWAEFFRIPNQNKLLQKYFPGSKHLKDLMYNTSLVLLNSHVSTAAPSALVPSIIEIGGCHILPPKPLPSNLQEYLDNSKNGVILVSMGSNFKSNEFPEEMINNILNTFGKLKENVLWKWESDVLSGQPSNVRIEQWIPQQAVLAHPNVKLFVTQGGVLSMLEAIHYGVPVLGIPIFGDQMFNVKHAEHAGFGLGIPFREFQGATFDTYLNQLLNNDKYRENAKHRSSILHDQQLQPMERAIYWIEYVIRHRGAPHLKSAALSLSWYQYLLLDVIVFFLVVIAAIGLVSYKISKLLCRTNRLNIIGKRKKTD